MRGAGEVDAHGNVQLSGSGALGDGLADLVKTGLTPKGGKAPRVRADTSAISSAAGRIPRRSTRRRRAPSAATPQSLRHGRRSGLGDHHPHQQRA